MAGSRARWKFCGLKDEALLEKRLRLHSGYPGEDGENLFVSRRRDLPKEEELMHFWAYESWEKRFKKFQKRRKVKKRKGKGTKQRLNAQMKLGKPISFYEKNSEKISL